ncbi:auxin response factor [Striga asiatica]|uniref:Auxin response factor n=1 Tax=Striga asiatica TaxID=4170 RepID=A0A5A7QE77_STRAF|nr:auxin response factor [Striga asiatica]
MINVMHSLEKPLNQLEKCLDPKLWLACAGGMARIPSPNSKVYYFPQGHAEHSNENLDFSKFPSIPPLIPCQVSSVKYSADPETDEVYAKIRLVPNELDFINEENGFFSEANESIEKEKPNSFAKTLTQSDANNGGGFSVPRYCAETIFPELDYSSEPPVQTILARDFQGQIWKFRHIYRGTPRRHLLTTGWGVFVNSKRLVAGDSVVFVREEKGEIRVGVRRAKSGIGCGPACFRGFGKNNNTENGGDCVGSVMEKVCGGRAFEVVYYPRAGAPEFVVRASEVWSGMRVGWRPGMRFKMAFETEDSSRISWFVGSVASVGAEDPVRLPNSPWRILERVNPWSVELISGVSSINLSHLGLPRKRPRQHDSEFNPFGREFEMAKTFFSGNLLSCSPDIQGARHVKFLQPSSHDPFNSLVRIPKKNLLFTESLMKREPSPVFVLFGQPILTEEQMESRKNVGTTSNGSGSGSGVVQSFRPEGLSDEESL